MNVLEQIAELEGQLIYVEGQLEKDLDRWEKDEYMCLKISYIRKIAKLKLHVKNHPEVFEK